MSVSLSSNGGAQPASVQWDLTYASADLGPASGTYYTTGAAASAAGKQVQCNVVTAGDIRCLVAALNTTTMGDGVLATITLQISSTTTQTSTPIALTGVSASDPNGKAINMTGGNATITINQPSPAPALSSLTCTPASLTPPGTSSCTVTLTAAATSATTVTLTSNSASVTVPASVTIASGSASANFTANAPSAASANTSAVITASLNGNSVNFTLTLTAGQGAQPPVSALACNPSVVTGGASASCTVSLTAAAPTGGTPVSISSNSPNTTAPVQVTVPAGSTSTSFTVNTQAVTTIQHPVLSAASSGVTVTTTLTLQSSTLALAGLICAPSTVAATATATCSVGLTAVAPSGGVTITLSSSDSLVTLPATVVVPAGSSTLDFFASAGTPEADTTVVLAAGLNSATIKFSLTVLSSPTAPESLSCSPAGVKPGGSTICTVTLSGAAPAGGLTVSLASNNPEVTVPPGTTISSGSTLGAFDAKVAPDAGAAKVTITATFRSSFVHGAISITSASSAPALNVPGPQSTKPGKLTSFRISATDPAGLPVTLSASGLPSNATFDAATGSFGWSPQNSQYGVYTVHFTATDSAQNSSSEDVVIKVQSDTPEIASLANAASYADEGGCSPGTVATLLGAGFVNSEGKAAQTSPLPTELNGLKVMINGTYVPVFYAGEFQVNFQCPALIPGEAITLQVQSTTGSSAPMFSKQQYATPGIFTLDGSGKGQGAILLAGSNVVVMPHTDGIPSQPAKPGAYISIYAAGLGPVSEDLPVGRPAPVDRLVTVKSPTDVLIGGAKAKVQFAGLAPGFIGLYQVNVQVPEGATAGDAIPLQIVTHLPDGTGANSNVVTIAIAAAH